MKKIIFTTLLAIALLGFTTFPFYLQAQEKADNFRLGNSSSTLVHGNQLVLITHGWDPGLTGVPVWLESMRDAIAENYLDNERNYVEIRVAKNSGNLVSTCTFRDFSINTGNSGTILAILDWSAVANHLFSGVRSQEVAAAAINSLITSQQERAPLAQLPIHLIGHSRGAGLICELSRLLGEQGIIVDQVTLLDPHPLTTSDQQPSFDKIIDTPISIYENIVFADCYYQNIAYPQGEYFDGTYNRYFPTLPGGFHRNLLSIYPDHRNLYLMYQGTINLDNPVANGEAEMGNREREAWFNENENSGAYTGFHYSRIKNSDDRLSSETPVHNSDRINQGLHQELGGNGNRTSLTWGAASWPNIASFKISKAGVPLTSDVNLLPIGTAIELEYLALDYDSGYTVTLFADQDRNPYNHNNLQTIAKIKQDLSTGKNLYSHTIDWHTAGLPGNKYIYLYAKIEDAEHTRYFYADPALEFTYTSGNYNYYLPCFQSGDGYWTGLAVTNTNNQQSSPFSVTVYNSTGDTLSQEYPPPLPPKGQNSLAVASHLQTSGWILINSHCELDGLSFLGNDSMIDIPFSRELFLQLIIPHIAQTKQWDTILSICNPHPTACDLTLTYTDKSGLSELFHNDSLGAFSNGNYPLETVFPETPLDGTITISANQGVAAFALYTNHKSGGNYAAGINACGR
ncbi:MAG: hypothetical protein U9N63_07555 [Pseudomonadota bacterium]|nr:hypothetical protein [Pseudomonadota bacterium]